jgi:hypothetical protein
MEKCVNHFEVTDVGEDYDLVPLLQDDIREFE